MAGLAGATRLTRPDFRLNLAKFTNTKAGILRAGLSSRIKQE